MDQIHLNATPAGTSLAMMKKSSYLNDDSQQDDPALRGTSSQHTNALKSKHIVIIRKK